MFKTLRRIFSLSRSGVFGALGLFLLCVVLPVSAAGQISSIITPAHSLKWPETPVELAAANRMPLRAVASSLGSKVAVPGKTGGGVYEFRFAYLEPHRVYLVVGGLTRAGVWLITLQPVGGGKYRQTLLNLFINGSAATSLVDLRGNGVDEVIGLQLIDDRGSATAPIYWYTIYQFHDGKPVDVSAQFPEYYTNVVLPPLDYLQNVLKSTKTNVPGKVLQAHPGQLGYGTPGIELAEIGFVRLKYQHVILGHKNAGLDQALQWAQSSNSQIGVLGVQSLAEMAAPQAWEEIHKLWNSPDYAVCSEARGFWLKRIGEPYTEKYECPRPGARKH